MQPLTPEEKQKLLDKGLSQEEIDELERQASERFTKEPKGESK